MPTVNKQIRSMKSTEGVTNQQSTADGWGASEGIKMLIYGRSGSGKTTLWSSFPGPILAILCSGGTRPGELKSIDTPENRKKITPKICTSVAQCKELISEATDYQTVVLDHGSGLQDLTLKEILGLEELPAQKSWGMATQQQYGQSSLMCKEVFRSLLSLPNNVVIVAQEREFGSESGSDLIAPTVGAALTPSVTGWLNPACDYVVQTFIRPVMKEQTTKIGTKEMKQLVRGKGVEYCLRTEPHDVYTTKFRVPKGHPLPECIVDPTYTKIVNIIRGLNS